MSAMVTTLVTATSPALRLIIGATTLPPSSTKLSAPAAFIATPVLKAWPRFRLPESATWLSRAAPAWPVTG